MKKPITTEDLLSLDIMGSFFSESSIVPGFSNLRLKRINAQNVMSGNIVVGYDLETVKDGKDTTVSVWAKTMERNIYSLLEFLLDGNWGRFLPKYFKYIDSMGVGLYIEIGGRPLKDFQEDISFWLKYSSKVGELIASLQGLDIPKDLLKTYTKEEEKIFLDNSVKKISKYSDSESGRFKSMAETYFSKLSTQFFSENEFTFNHFDTQQSNIFFDEESGAIRILDFDLAKRFHPALDPSNFFAHIYVMLRYYHSAENVVKVLSLFLNGYLLGHDSEKEKIVSSLNVFKLRGIIQIAQTTVNVFNEPVEDSQKVFKLLEELEELDLRELV